MKTKYSENKELNLDITNDFVFTKVFSDKELCLELLRRILPDLDIDYIRYIENQKTFEANTDTKGIRLDVYVKDNNNKVYDIEIQVVNRDDLAKRSRFYNSLLDFDALGKGKSYRELSDTYVIFICMFDMFKKGRAKYSFCHMCCEDTEIILNTGQNTIFLNPFGSREDIDDKLASFLDYLSGKNTFVNQDIYINKLKEKVKKINMEKGDIRDIMTFEQRLIEERYDGRLEGRAEGKAEGKAYMLDNMLKRGYSESEISNITGMSIAEIKEILKYHLDK